MDMTAHDAEHGVPLLGEALPDENSAPIGASVLSSSINLLNTLVGAGMLALPYAFAVQGWAVGMTTLLLAAFGSATGQMLLSVCAQRLHSRSTSYGALASVALPQLTYAIDAAVAIKCFGVATSYLLVIGDQMPSVAHAMGLEGALAHRATWIAAAMTAVAPLACLRSLDALRHTSIIALLAAVYLVALVAAYAWIPALSDLIPCKAAAVPCTAAPLTWGLHLDYVKALPIFIFSFTCHQNLFLVHNEQADNSVRAVGRAVANAVGAALSIYILVGVSGYHTFGDQAKADILVEYPDSTGVTLCRVAIVILVAFSYPLQTTPCRQHLIHLLSSAAPGSIGSPTAAPAVFAVVTAALLTSSFLVALNVTSLGLVLAVVGATASTTLSYILPGTFYIQMFQAEKQHARIWLAGAMVALGFALMSVSLTVIFVYHASG